MPKQKQPVALSNCCQSPGASAHLRLQPHSTQSSRLALLSNMRLQTNQRPTSRSIGLHNRAAQNVALVHPQLAELLRHPAFPDVYGSMTVHVPKQHEGFAHKLAAWLEPRAKGATAGPFAIETGQKGRMLACMSAAQDASVCTECLIRQWIVPGTQLFRLADLIHRVPAHRHRWRRPVCERCGNGGGPGGSGGSSGWHQHPAGAAAPRLQLRRSGVTAGCCGRRRRAGPAVQRGTDVPRLPARRWPPGCALSAVTRVSKQGFQYWYLLNSIRS